MYAVIDDRGTQIKVSPGDVVDIDLLPGATGDERTLTFDRILAIGGGDSNEADASGDQPLEAGTLGTPYIEGATVAAEILEEVRGDKLKVVMYKRRKGQKKTRGHRQRYLRVKITGING